MGPLRFGGGFLVAGADFLPTIQSGISAQSALLLVPTVRSRVHRYNLSIGVVYGRYSGWLGAPSLLLPKQ